MRHVSLPECAFDVVSITKELNDFTVFEALGLTALQFLEWSATRSRHGFEMVLQSVNLSFQLIYSLHQVADHICLGVRQS